MPCHHRNDLRREATDFLTDRPSSPSIAAGTLKSFLVAQMVKNLPAMQETWVQSLGWEDPLEKG